MKRCSPKVTNPLENKVKTRLCAERRLGQGTRTSHQVTVCLMRGPGANRKLFLGNEWAQDPRPNLKSQPRVLRGQGANPKLFLGNDWAQGPGPTLKSHLRVLKDSGTNPKPFLGNDWAQGPGPTLKSHLRVLRDSGTNPRLFPGNDCIEQRTQKDVNHTCVC